MKRALSDKVTEIDNAKKANPLDLSSDQDLSVGLMNLIAIERATGDDDLYDAVRDMREKYMGKIVAAAPIDTNVAERVAWHLLGDAMAQMDARDASYADYDRAYELYAMFWGMVMGLADVKDLVPEIWARANGDRK